MSASSRDEQALHSGNYSIVLCFRAGPLRSSRMRLLMRCPQEKVGVCAMLVKKVSVTVSLSSYTRDR